MRDIKEVLDDKKFILIVNLLKVLHREHLELARIMLAHILGRDRYKETYPEMAANWDNVFNEIVNTGLKVKEEDFYD